jgi:hypothetical protein
MLRQRIRLRAMHSASVFLRDLIDREVARIHVRGELGLEGGADGSQLVPDDAAEEGVEFDFGRAVDVAAFFAEAVGCVAEEAGWEVLVRGSLVGR